MEQTKSRRSWRVFLRWTGWVLLFQFVLINISASIYAYRLTHFSNDPALRQAPRQTNIFRKTWKIFTGPEFPKSQIRVTPSFSYDTITLQTKEGTSIDAWYSRPDSAKGTVILFHGISASKSYMVREAEAFREMGYAVCMVDFRAHGNSGGLVTTMGRKETEEVKLAFDFVRANSSQPVFLWGVSMGAVVLLKALHDFPLQPAGVILEMPFLSLQSHLKARARVLGFPQQPFAFLVTGWIGMEQGFNGFRHTATRYAASVHCPVLLQYGARDSYVLKEEIEEVFKAIPAADKLKIAYPFADHESLLQHDPSRWQREVSLFLEKGSR